MITCSICEEEIKAEDETAYNFRKIFHLDCMEEFEGDLEELIE